MSNQVNRGFLIAATRLPTANYTLIANGKYVTKLRLLADVLGLCPRWCKNDTNLPLSTIVVDLQIFQWSSTCFQKIV